MWELLFQSAASATAGINVVYRVSGSKHVDKTKHFVAVCDVELQLQVFPFLIALHIHGGTFAC